MCLRVHAHSMRIANLWQDGEINLLFFFKIICHVFIALSFTHDLENYNNEHFSGGFNKEKYIIQADM